MPRLQQLSDESDGHCSQTTATPQARRWFETAPKYHTDRPNPPDASNMGPAAMPGIAQAESTEPSIHLINITKCRARDSFFMGGRRGQLGGEKTTILSMHKLF